ncbi:thiamine transport system ATP-binding protein [Sanguibacter gelidistatuariae]|uniref:ABC-type quaternary amine transporter n=1 Tax=Sanguibacter gelidistatuariae TaxID=1814289 RepID=A0A1G6GSK5_9MICO|nr:ABC transporter ATP-binding protein [Sanguibacter gelidistatuariae]SDB84924.1 thiamine transport system ATP-binding protein [Sanguibacter gelidistatuariae]
MAAIDHEIAAISGAVSALPDAGARPAQDAPAAQGRGQGDERATGRTASESQAGSRATAGLRIEDVVVTYPAARTGRGSAGTVTAVNHVDLTVAPGEVMALLGPSGCGKSSLLRAVAGLEPVAGGRVLWDGADVGSVPVHLRGFGLMFQDGQLFAHRNVAGNVEYGLRMHGMPKASRRARVAELLDVVGLPGSESRSVATMSGGERQRVALARALAPQPQLLLLDEPLSALDRALRERLAGDLRAALVATGTTALFVTHDHDEAFTVADRVAVMSGGRLLQVDEPSRLWAAPASREVAEFLGYQAFIPADGGWLAIGPQGLIASAGAGAGAGAGGNATSASGTASAGWTATGAGPGAAAFSGVVVSAAFRRGYTEVVVDADLGDGIQRCAAVAHGAALWSPGTQVTLTVAATAPVFVPATPDHPRPLSPAPTR